MSLKTHFLEQLFNDVFDISQKDFVYPVEEKELTHVEITLDQSKKSVCPSGPPWPEIRDLFYSDVHSPLKTSR